MEVISLNAGGGTQTSIGNMCHKYSFSVSHDTFRRGNLIATLESISWLFVAFVADNNNNRSANGTGILRLTDDL